jgi:hypothetical protein
MHYRINRRGFSGWNPGSASGAAFRFFFFAFGFFASSLSSACFFSFYKAVKIIFA